MTQDRHFAGGQLVLGRAGPIATLELNQPAKRNAISAAMWNAFPEVAYAVSTDPTIRVLLVRGSGQLAFSAGADIAEFHDVYATAESTKAYNDAVRSGQAALRHLPRPVIAVIHGVCVGGGCGVALASDLRFAASDAQFAITPAKLGLAYSYADTAQLVEKVGPARAKDILFSGRMLEAGEALAISLIDRVVEAAQLDAEALTYAQTLAAVSLSSMQTAKTFVNQIAEGRAGVPANTEALFQAGFTSADFQEGYKAFLEKRKPKFQ